MKSITPLAAADEAWAQARPAPPGARLSASAWLAREMPQPDFLLGEWLHSTSRAILTAPTGLGKSNFVLSAMASIAAGRPFLHWSGSSRPRRCLYVDGEMSARLMRSRVEDAVRRIGCVPDTLYVLCRDDEDGLPPLNTKAGQDYIDRLIEELGGIDLVSFDNVMSLIVGDMKEEESWANTLPWIKDLTRRGIAQIWVHHSGHDSSRGYGTSTRLWQLDTAIHLEPIDGATTDIAFRLKFAKARERAPHNRTDFCDVKVTLVEDQWHAEPSERRTMRKPPSPKAMSFHRALSDALVAHGRTRPESAGRPSVTAHQWREECIRLGLLDAEDTNRRRALISKYRIELIADGWVACNGDFMWLTTASA